MRILFENLSHEKYDAIVKYLGKWPQIPISPSYSASPLIINSVETMPGNPPVYREVEILVHDNADRNPDTYKTISEAIKGLVDVILSDKL